jgi:signal peptidase I
MSKGSVLGENVRTVIYALALAMAIRFAFVQPFRIPSGSMQPTLMVGDYIVVTKWSYGYSRFSVTPLEALVPKGRVMARKPERGDIVVFRPERQPDKDFVKRLVGMPGDTLQVQDGVLFINGEPAPKVSLGERTFIESDGIPTRIEAYTETLPNGVTYTVFDRVEDGRYDNTAAFVVPEGRYFMMGDDRDNSVDSRGAEVGLVPFENLVGKAQFVFVSFDETTKLWQPWTLITGLRGERFVKGVE